MNKTQKIIGKNALILMVKGETQIASQIFVYEHFREIRVNTEELEVKVLMAYDDSYHRVFKVIVSDKLPKDEAVNILLGFYNNLLNAAMKLTHEEIENIKNQKKQQELEFSKKKENGK